MAKSTGELSLSCLALRFFFFTDLDFFSLVGRLESSSSESSTREPLADGWLESRLSLLRWRRGRRAELRSGAKESCKLERRSAGRRSGSLGSWRQREWESIWREQFSISSVIWVTTWIFSSPSSWLIMSALCNCVCRRFFWVTSCSP